MTQRERIREETRETTRTPGGAARVSVYDTPGRGDDADVTRSYDADVTAARAVDRVRWGPVIAGIFAALSTLAALTVLGLAVGLTAFNANNADFGPFGLGAGIWGAISTLIAFFVGGWLAARTAAVGGHSNGILNGAMVWFVAIPLLLFALGSGIGTLARTVGGIAGTAVQAGAVAADDAAANPAAQSGAADALGAAAATAQAAAGNVTTTDVNNAADTAANTAWQTLLALGLAAAAAIGGGYLGSRPVATTTARRRAA